MSIVPVSSGGMTADEFEKWASDYNIVHSSWPESLPAVRFSHWSTPQRILFYALSTTNEETTRAFNDHWYLEGWHPEHGKKKKEKAKEKAYKEKMHEGVHSPLSYGDVAAEYEGDAQYIERLEAKYDALLDEHKQLKAKYKALVEDKAMHPKRKLRSDNDI